MVVPHDDVENSERWHDFPRVRLAKKNYDHIFAFESLPPAEWLEAAVTVWWVPMVEFTTRGQLERAPSGLNILWHSRAGFKAARQIRPDLHQIYLPFGPGGVIIPNIEVCKTPRVILHQRARCVDTEKVARLLLADESLGVEVTIWDNIRARTPMTIKDPRLTIVSGWINHDQWLAMAGLSDIYVATRAHEGVGLCVMEAAARACAIIGPDHTTTAEYFAEANLGGLRVPVLSDDSANAKRDWLCPRYEWQVGDESTIPDLVQTIRSLALDPALLSSTKHHAHVRCESLDNEFEDGLRDLFSNFVERPVSIAPKTRRRILSIQVCRWGGQGLFELWMLRELSRRSYLSLFSTCLWNQSYDKGEQQEQCRIMEASSVRHVAPSADDMLSIDPDIVILHWSSGSDQLWSDEHRSELMVFLGGTRATVITIAHNVDSNPWPEWLSSGLILHPTPEALKTCDDEREGVARAVLGHFIDPDTFSTPVTPRSDSKFTIGIVGRVRWTKLDPAYLHELGEFKRRFPVVRFLWLGGTSDGYMEGDSILDETIKPIFVSAYGQERFHYMDQMSVAIHLSGVQESFGLASVELACRNIPVITNRPEVYANIREGSILVGGPADIKLVLERMVRDASIINDLKKGCQKVASRVKHFEQWESEFMRYVGNLFYGASEPESPWTVIVTAHRMEGTIKRCLDSVLANYPAKIVVVVDGNQDQTFDKVREWAEQNGRDDRNLEILFYPGAGHCQAWSWGQALNHVSTGLVAFVDGDDELISKSLRMMWTAYASDPNVVLAWSDQYVLNGKDIPVHGMSFSSMPEGSILESIEAGQNVISHLITARYAALQLIHIDPDLLASADKDLALKLEEVGKVRFVQQKLYRYRWNRSGSVTAEKAELQRQCRERVINAARKRRRLPVVRD